jgi:tetratricopeptide (TPR) repeat protein
MKPNRIVAAVGLALLAELMAVNPTRADEASDACVEGILLVEDGKSREALPHLNRAIALDRRFAAAYAYRGLAYFDLRQYQRALQDCNTALQIDPKLAHGYYHRGVILQAQRQRLRAMQDFNKALELDPKLSGAYTDRSSLRLEAGDLTGAIRDCTRAIELEPRAAQAYGNRGACRLALASMVRAFGKGAERAFDTDPTTDKVAQLEADGKADLERCYELNPGLRRHFERFSNQLRLQQQLRGAVQRNIDELFKGLAD